MSSPCLFVRAPEQASVHPRILTISPSKANRVFAPRRRVLMQSRRTFALWLFLFCLISPLALTQVYKVTDLGPLAPTAINNWGQVAGNLSGHAFIWTQWGRLDLGTLAGGTFSSAAAINDFGEVAGTADGPGTVISPEPSIVPNQQCSDLTQPFVWTPRKGMQGLGGIGYSIFFYSEPSEFCLLPWVATGINDLGQVVGWTEGPDQYGYGLLWTSAQGMAIFGGSWAPTQANGVSNTGAIVGLNSCCGSYPVTAASWGVTTDLGTPFLTGGANSSANGVNDRGQVVGWSTTTPLNPYEDEGFIMHAVLWTAGGEILDLGTLPGDTLSAASNINFFGQVIGSSGNTTTMSFFYSGYQIAVIGHPFIWSQRSGMQDLNTLISAKSGWVLNSATGINFWGQIVGSGMRHGKPHGFLLTPKF